MKVGIYAGSFNPFHKGHYNILTKAERVFDKVIIAKGVNPEKKNSYLSNVPPIVFEKFDTYAYDGLLTKFIETFKSNNPNDTPVLIRGLRNSTDLQYEMTQYRYLQDLMPDIQVVSIFCDKQYEHISSSGIRLLSVYGADKVKDYLIE